MCVFCPLVPAHGIDCAAIFLTAPSRPSKHPPRYTRPASPLQRNSELPLSSSLLGHSTGPSARKAASGPSNKQPTTKGALGLVEKIQPLSFVLQAPEEQTDNWDDDFEEGISFTKLQGISSLFIRERKNNSKLNSSLISTRTDAFC